MRSAIQYPSAGPEQDEGQEREQDAAVQVVDLALDRLLPQRQRHGEQRRSAPAICTGAAATMYANSPSRSSPT